MLEILICLIAVAAIMFLWHRFYPKSFKQVYKMVKTTAENKMGNKIANNQIEIERRRYEPYLDLMANVIRRHAYSFPIQVIVPAAFDWKPIADLEMGKVCRATVLRTTRIQADVPDPPEHYEDVLRFIRSALADYYAVYNNTSVQLVIWRVYGDDTNLFLDFCLWATQAMPVYGKLLAEREARTQAVRQQPATPDDKDYG